MGLSAIFVITALWLIKMLFGASTKMSKEKKGEATRSPHSSGVDITSNYLHCKMLWAIRWWIIRGGWTLVDHGGRESCGISSLWPKEVKKMMKQHTRPWIHGWGPLQYLLSLLYDVSTCCLDDICKIGVVIYCGVHCLKGKNEGTKAKEPKRELNSSPPPHHFTKADTSSPRILCTILVRIWDRWVIFDSMWGISTMKWGGESSKMSSFVIN